MFEQHGKVIPYFVIGERAPVKVEENKNEVDERIDDNAIELVLTHEGLYIRLELVMNQLHRPDGDDCQRLAIVVLFIIIVFEGILDILESPALLRGIGDVGFRSFLIVPYHFAKELLPFPAVLVECLGALGQPEQVISGDLVARQAHHLRASL